MQTLYGIHVNNVGQVSVDVFSPKHSGVSKWRMYFAVKPTTLIRLRRIYAAHPKSFYITREWSPNRWKAYKKWSTSWLDKVGYPPVKASLDYLATSEPPL
jgi:hypothetical protein